MTPLWVLLLSEAGVLLEGALPEEEVPESPQPAIAAADIIATMAMARDFFR